MRQLDDDPLTFADELWGETAQQPLPLLSTFDDPEAFFEANVRSPEPVRLHDDPESVLALVRELLPEIPPENVLKRLAEDPIESIHGLQEMVRIISYKRRNGERLNRSERLFYECLKNGGVAGGIVGKHGADELRWVGYIVTRLSASDRLAVLVACPRSVRFTPTGALLREIRRRDQDQCRVCGARTNLQADHRQAIVEGGGDEELQRNPDAWQLLCRACNCKKRGACASCPNKSKDSSVRKSNCMSCFWANPTDHTHVAMEQGMLVMAFLPVEKGVQVKRLIEEMRAG